MKFGLALPHYDFSLPKGRPIDWPLLRDWAQRAEDMGFDSLWVSDHLFLDLARYGGPADKQFSMECFTTLAALSQWTSRIRLGALVVCNDLRAPSVVAKMAATLGVFSGGRFELGMGAGWYEPEYRVAGVAFDPPAVRVRRLGEAVQLVRGMLSESPFNFDGLFYGVKDCWTVPVPSSLPVWIGGKGDMVVQTAGRHADGFNAVWAWTPEAYAGRIRLLEASAKAAGRDPSAIRKSVGLHCLPGRDEREVETRWQRYVAAGSAGIGGSLNFQSWRKDKLAGTPQVLATKIDAFKASGAEEVILSFGLIPFQLCDDSAVEEFAGEVMPVVQSTD